MLRGLASMCEVLGSISNTEKKSYIQTYIHKTKKQYYSEASNFKFFICSVGNRTQDSISAKQALHTEVHSQILFENSL